MVMGGLSISWTSPYFHMLNPPGTTSALRHLLGAFYDNQAMKFCATFAVPRAPTYFTQAVNLFFQREWRVIPKIILSDDMKMYDGQILYNDT